MGLNLSKNQDNDPNNSCDKCDKYICEHVHSHIVKVQFEGCGPSQEVRNMANGFKIMHNFNKSIRPFAYTGNNDTRPFFKQMDDYIKRNTTKVIQGGGNNDSSDLSIDSNFLNTPVEETTASSNFLPNNNSLDTDSSDFVPRRITDSSDIMRGGAKVKKNEDEDDEGEGDEDDEDDEEDAEDDEEKEEKEEDDEDDEEGDEDADQERMVRNLDNASELTITNTNTTSSDVYGQNGRIQVPDTSSAIRIKKFKQNMIHENGGYSKNRKKVNSKNKKQYKSKKDKKKNDANSELSSVLVLPKHMLD